MHKESLVVLFSDIRGFMRLAAALGDRMPAFVQSFYEKAGAAVVDAGGKVLKYIGDALLCIFPRGREKDAVRCALRMRDDFAELLRACGARVDSELCAAVSSGTVTRGVFGHSSLRLDDVMGDVVSHAAVLSAAPGVKVTGPVREAIGGEFPLSELPPLTLKWSGEPLAAWEVLPGPRPPGSPPRRT